MEEGVSWRFTIPGMPPSVNNSYHITEQKAVRKSGEPYTFRTLSKRKPILDYQAAAAMVCRTAKPRGWAPAGFVRVSMELWVGRHIDSDNTIKAIFDAIQAATEINDKWYLPCIVAMHTKRPEAEWRVEVEISDA